MNIFIFGPSCSGKSTLAKDLKERMEESWSVLDRDDLVQKEWIQEAKANEEVDRRLEGQTRMIVDAQVPWRDKKAGELFFLVYPSLDVLLERDAARTGRLKRPEKRAYWAREYVIETHKKLGEYESCFFDRSFTSGESLDQEVGAILELLKPQKV